MMPPPAKRNKDSQTRPIQHHSNGIQSTPTHEKHRPGHYEGLLDWVVIFAIIAWQCHAAAAAPHRLYVLECRLQPRDCKPLKDRLEDRHTIQVAAKAVAAAPGAVTAGPGPASHILLHQGLRMIQAYGCVWHITS